MLIHHFESETQGFQGLVDQNDRGKPESPRFTSLARNSPSHIMNENIFLDKGGGQLEPTSFS